MLKESRTQRISQHQVSQFDLLIQPIPYSFGPNNNNNNYSSSLNGSESIAHGFEGHESERNNSFSKIQLVSQMLSQLCT